ncbi:hypothetical protein PANG_00027 [Paenibacillus phage PG1]|uniref:hypothetical protein n=1 Tax=Paenibacillus phage PG1 TaxID=754053 RepID=UPI000342623B|nr:hypothetical protein PANG_00027 [Paenibacillus phage PG1]AGN33747.1 hypothetical protein PANG_00027 [Paenibacillus phage PG1]
MRDQEVITMKTYYDSKDVRNLLDLGSVRTAQQRIKTLNDELAADGFWVERGKVPVAFFHEKYPYIQKGAMK